MNRFINTCLLDKIAACLVDGDKSPFSNFRQTRIKQLGRYTYPTFSYVFPVCSCLVAASSPCGSHVVSAVHNTSMIYHHQTDIITQNSTALLRIQQKSLLPCEAESQKLNFPRKEEDSFAEYEEALLNFENRQLPVDVRQIGNITMEELSNNESTWGPQGEEAATRQEHRIHRIHVAESRICLATQLLNLCLRKTGEGRLVTVTETCSDFI
ncbi:hypothetical protein T03_6584 [Trichinella britovi]|uniref:Uncharacterized protein n=1 Tax=Trichinella britovi TaxID=45882 RepID=A0A0V1C8P6_TRIBR|nr:hypothetical protein T03_6584 [Trichinella britovi]